MVALPDFSKGNHAGRDFWKIIPWNLAWLPLQSLAVKKTFFCAKFGRWKTFKISWKVPVKFFQAAWEGLNNFHTRFGSFLGSFFHVFQTVFRIDLKVFQGQFRSADMPP